MQVQQLTIGTTAVLVEFTVKPQVGVRLLAREGNTGDVFLGTTDAVTDETGVLVAKGPPETSFVTVVPEGHFEQSPGTIYLIGSDVDQVVDVVSQ